MKPRMSRRGLLRIVVVSGAAGATGFALTEPAEAAPGTVIAGTVIAGTVVSADTDGMVVRTADATVTVTAAAGAKLYSGADGMVAGTEAFRVGDRVGVQGAVTGQSLAASRIGSIFTPIEARIDRVSAGGTAADTSAGPVVLSGRLPETAPADRGRLAPGTTLSGMGWTDPSSGQRYLLVHG
jgi:hypothetical protein